MLVEVRIKRRDKMGAGESERERSRMVRGEAKR